MQCLWLEHVGLHSSHVVEQSGYGAHEPCGPTCEHQPQPSSSEQPQEVETSAHVSMHLRLHALRHVLWSDGHSRHVVVHWLAGSQVFVD